MNITKYFISLLIAFIINVNCSPYNHLDIQYAPLILSAGDHNGNIVRGKDGKYLKINIASSEVNDKDKPNYEVDIVDIVPALAKIRKDNNNVLKIENKFKELYIKSERLATYRMDHTYDELNNINSDDNLFKFYTSSLFNGYKSSYKIMKDQFDRHVEEKDLLRFFGVKTVNGDKSMDILTFFNKKYELDNKDRKYNQKNRQNRKIDANDRNNELFIESIREKREFKPVDKDRNHINGNDLKKFEIFIEISKLCREQERCRNLFFNDNKTYSLLLERGENDNIYHFFVTNINNGGIHRFITKKNKDGVYTMNEDINFLRNNVAINKLNGHNKYTGQLGNNKYVHIKGIGLVKDFETKISAEGEILQSEDYGVDFETLINDGEINIDLAKDDVLSDKIIGTRVAKKGDIDKYNENNPEHKIKNENILCDYFHKNYISLGGETIKFIKERSKIYEDKEKFYNKQKMSKIEGIFKKLNSDDLDNKISMIENIINKINEYYEEENKGKSNKEIQKNNIEKDNLIKDLRNMYIITESNFKEQYFNDYKYSVKDELDKKYENEFNLYKNEYIRNHEEEIRNIPEDKQEKYIKSIFYNSKDINELNKEIDKILKDKYIKIEGINKNDFKKIYEKEHGDDLSSEEKNKIINELVEINNNDYSKKYDEWSKTKDYKNKGNVYLMEKYIKEKNLDFKFNNEYENLNNAKKYKKLQSFLKTQNKVEDCKKYVDNLNENEIKENLKRDFIYEQGKNEYENECKEYKNCKNDETKLTDLINKKYYTKERFNKYLKMYLEELKNKIDILNSFKYEFEIIGDTAAQNSLEINYPVNYNNRLTTGDHIPYSFVGPISSDGTHFREQIENVNLVKYAYEKAKLSKNKYEQCIGKFKRDGSCKVCNQLRILQGTYIDTTTIETLRMLKEMKLDPNILPYTTEINSINDIKQLLKDANKNDNIYKFMVDTYKNNQGSFDEVQSEQFIKNINSITNENIIKYTDSRYYDNENDNISEEDIENLLTLRAEALSLHENKYGEIDDLEFEELNKNDSQSKYNKDRFKNIIKKLANLVKINPNTIIDAKDPKLAINSLCEKLDELDEIEDIDNINNELKELKSLNNFEFYQNEDTSLNSEVIHLLSNTIRDKIGENRDGDEEIRASENNLKILNKRNPTKSSYEEFADALAFTILAAGKEDGSLAKELDENGNLVPIKINVLNNGEESYMGINEIIPSLQGLQGKELEDKFLKLYEMSMVYYLENFDTYYDENKKRLIYRKKPMNTIKDSNLYSNIIKPYNIKDNDEIEHFDLSFDNMNIHYSTDTELDNKFKSFISSIDNEELENIDINNNEDVSKIMDKYWKESSKESTNYDKDKESLYKIIALHCAKMTKCKEQFKNTNNNKLSFSIIDYSSKEKDDNINNYSFILHNDETEQTINEFTLQRNNKGNSYKLDEINNYKEYSYNEIYNYKNDKNASKVTINNEKYLMKPGIGLVAEAGYNFEDSNGNIVEPEQYAVKNSNSNKIINCESIESKYDVKNNGEYDMNLVKEEALNFKSVNNEMKINGQTSNIRDSDVLLVKEIGGKLLEKRGANSSNKDCNLSNNEVNVLNNYSYLLMKNDLYDENKGLIHYDSNFDTKFNELKQSTNIQNEIRKVKNEQKVCLSGSNCLSELKISKIYDVENELTDLLHTLQTYDSENIIIKKDEKSISTPKELCKDAESLFKVLSISADSYANNINEIKEEDSKKIINRMKNIVRGLNYRYLHGDFIAHETIKDIDMYKLSDMHSLFNDMLDAHESKYGKITDDKGNTIKKIYSKITGAEYDSKYVNDKLHESINNIHDLLNENTEDISNMNHVDNMNINDKTIKNDDRTKEMKNVIKELSKLKAIGSHESKENLKTNLLTIYDKLNILENIVDKENYNKNTFVNNSEMIYKLKYTVLGVLKNNFPSDNNVKLREYFHKDTISGVQKTKVKSTNILNSNHITHGVNMDEKIIHDSRYTSYVKGYFDNLKYRVYTVQNEEEHKELINKIDEVHNEINEKVKAFNKYTSPEGHYEEADHIIELIDNYNELVATELSLHDTNNDDINYIYVSNDMETFERLNYMRVKLFNKSANQIMKDNSNEFNIKDNENLENRIDKDRAKHYRFNDKFEYEPSFYDYKVLMKDNINSNEDVLKKLVDTSKNNKLLLEMKDSFKLGYKLTLNELSNYRDQFMVDGINGVSQHKKMFNNVKNNNLRYFETQEQTENRFKNDLISEAKLNININSNNLDDVIIAINRDYNDMTINVENQLVNICINKKNELVRYSGNTPSDAYNELSNDYNSFTSLSEKALKKNSNNNKEEYNKRFNLNKNLENHNSIHASKLSSSNPLIKKPPKFIVHKNSGTRPGSKIKRRYYHRYY